jgi:hypothetical protein
MATSVTLTKEQEKFLDDQIEAGHFSSRSEILRQAINKYIEECEVSELLKSIKQADAGKIFYGDLDKLSKAI